MDNTDDADPSCARFNAPLGCLRRECPGPIEGRDLGAYFNARTEVVIHCDGLPVALLDVSWHEPGRNTWTGGEGLPHFLRGAGGFEFDLNGTATVGFFFHAHDGSLESDFWGRGCATNTSRCARPPGAEA